MHWSVNFVIFAIVLHTLNGEGESTTTATTVPWRPSAMQTTYSSSTETHFKLTSKCVKLLYSKPEFVIRRNV